jgi:hypothetical protein
VRGRRSGEDSLAVVGEVILRDRNALTSVCTCRKRYACVQRVEGLQESQESSKLLESREYEVSIRSEGRARFGVSWRGDTCECVKVPLVDNECSGGGSRKGGGRKI